MSTSFFFHDFFFGIIWANEVSILAHDGVTLKPTAHVFPPGQPVLE
jgi:hypothetical protein